MVERAEIRLFTHAECTLTKEHRLVSRKGVCVKSQLASILKQDERKVPSNIWLHAKDASGKLLQSMQGERLWQAAARRVREEREAAEATVTKLD